MTSELPKRDAKTLIEALRIRALALTGERWERNATRDMMKEAAQMLEDVGFGCINCHMPFGSTSYGFGPSTPPGAERREVGPLCEKCYNLIHVHIGVKE